MPDSCCFWLDYLIGKQRSGIIVRVCGCIVYQNGLQYAAQRRNNGGSSNGRTADFGSVNLGSNPSPPASYNAESYGKRRLYG